MVDDRVVRSLARLAELFGAGADGRIDVPVRQEELASLAGTTRPAANRVLKGLEREGVVELHRRRNTVVNPVALRST